MDMHMLTTDTSTAAAWAASREQIDEAGLEALATDVRRSVVAMVDRAGLGHIGGGPSGPGNPLPPLWARPGHAPPPARGRGGGPLLPPPGALGRAAGPPPPA